MSNLDQDDGLDDSDDEVDEEDEEVHDDDGQNNPPNDNGS